MEINTYRARHRKCIYCEHIIFPSQEEIDAAEKSGAAFPKCWCHAKMKLVHESAPRPFCRVFKVRKDGEMG